jgi:hypothetical protein
MLPKPHPSSRISTRHVTPGDTTSRIARRVPSPLLAMFCNNSSSITTQAIRAAAGCNLPLPEAGLRRAGSPSRIPWSAAGQTATRTSSDLYPVPDQSEASSSHMSDTPSPSPEVKKRAGVNGQYPTPPESAEIKHERFSRVRRVGTGTHQDTPVVVAGAAAPPARHPSRRRTPISIDDLDLH